MSDLLTIRNTGKTPLTITLIHRVFCKGAKNCSCQVRRIQVFDRDPESGERKGKEKVQRFPKTLIVPVGKEVQVHPAIRSLPEFKSALKDRRVKVMTPPAEPKDGPRRPGPTTKNKKKK